LAAVVLHQGDVVVGLPVGVFRPVSFGVVLGLEDGVVFQDDVDFLEGVLGGLVLSVEDLEVGLEEEHVDLEVDF
jgi:hypothetical protein